jgi:transcriptional regulator with XRE-family HTH domain
MSSTPESNRVASKRESSRQPPTVGGARLRALRERAGKPQLLVEAEADLGTGYVQRIESGKVRQPERATLERILAALDARYSEQREILALFGYTIATSLPTEEELVWARHVCHDELHGVPFPAYLLDCGHRLIAWNRYVPHILVAVEDDPKQAQITHWCMFHLWFDPRYGTTLLVQNPTTFFAQMVHALQHEMQLFGNETWHHTLIHRLGQELPLFKHYWEQRHSTSYVIAARALVPVQLALPGAGRLQFRLSTERFTRDARFRIVYFFPGDPATMQQCAAWAREA